MTVVTPSYNMLGYLVRCRASVADQVGPTYEHIVVDGGSTDGTADWLGHQTGVRSIVEPDHGMYDAINKGLGIARGEIVSYLNCDEQYLPRTLAFVEWYFATHPNVDILFGDTLLIRPDGSLISVRKTYRPLWPLMLASHLYLHSSSMFLRRRVIDNGELFDPALRGAGDWEFVPRVLRKGYRGRHVRRFLSAFTMTGQNHSQTAASELNADSQRILPTIPTWVRRLELPLNTARVALKAISGGYFHRQPVSYAVYDSASATQRRTFQVPHASTAWRVN